MTHEKMTPLRERMIEDMRIHGMGDKAQKAHRLVDQSFTFDAKPAHLIITDVKEVQRQVIFRRNMGGVRDFEFGQFFGKLGLAVDHYDTAIFLRSQIMGDDIFDEIGFA